MMDITVINEYNDNDYQSLILNLASVISDTLELSEKTSCAVIFIDDEKIQTINKEYRFLDKPTDVISFALNDHDDAISGFDVSYEIGDIFISLDTAQRQAETLEHSLETEITFLFVHGFLHLLGYDHLNEDDETLMFSLQERIVNEYHLLYH